MTREEAIAYFKRHLDLYCVDGISREAEEMAIKALEQEPIAEERYQDLVEYFGDKDIAKCVLEDREEFKKWLERIKWHVRKTDELARKLEQEPRWIPVSERLPKYNKTVLVSVKQKGIEAMVFTAQRRRRVKTPDLFECCMDDEGWWDFRIAAWDDHEVIAWMPLPQSYTESEDKE